jgi:ATP-dependent Lon protease
MQQGINLYDEKGILQTLPKLRSAMDKHVEGFKFQKDRICKYLIDNSREKYTLSVLHLQSNHEIGKKVLMNDIADGLGRKTYFISMGPVYYVDDMIELLYGNDSHPGCILKAMLETGVNNPIIVFKDMDVLDEKCTLYFEKFIRELN